MRGQHGDHIPPAGPDCHRRAPDHRGCQTGRPYPRALAGGGSHRAHRVGGGGGALSHWTGGDTTIFLVLTFLINVSPPSFPELERSLTLSLHLPESLVRRFLRVLAIRLAGLSVAHSVLVPDESLPPVQLGLRAGGGPEPRNLQRVVGLSSVTRPPQLLLPES